MSDASSPAALTVRVAFAGHRSLDPTSLEASLTAAFALVAEAVVLTAARPVAPGQTETIADAYKAFWPGSGTQPRLDLLVGYAPGADRVAARLWRVGRHGSIHAAFPFADRTEPGRIAWTDGPDCNDPSLRIALDAPEGLDRPFEATSVLDGEASLRESPPRDAHLEQTRWLVRWADILIVAWNGELAAGTGGTADTVALALRKGMPVLWIDGATIRLLSAERLWLDQSFSELVDALGDAGRRDRTAPEASADALCELLAPMLAPPAAKPSDQGQEHGHGNNIDEETAARRDYASGNRVAPAPWTGWTGLPGFLLDQARFVPARLLVAGWRAFYGRLKPKPTGAPQPDAVTDEQIAQAKRDAQDIAHPMIDAAFRAADAKASFYGDLHRAMQAFLLVIAVLAVVAATIPAIFDKLKFWMVLVELILLGFAFWSMHLGFFATSHQRWSDIRRLAERLRALRATWPLGFDVGDYSALPAVSWTEWQARAILRAAGPPKSVVARDRRDAVVTALRLDPDGIVRGQSGYNASTTLRMHRLQRALHRIENWTFCGLMGALAIFLLVYWFFFAAVPDDHSVRAMVKHAVGGAILMLSAIIPTVAAACLAIDAKLGIEENARRSESLAEQFSVIDLKMADTKSFAYVEELLRDAAQLLTKDIDGWRDAAVRRRIAML